MLLTCPSCSMRYVVADAAIGEEGRTVRCASCGHQWHQQGFTPVEIIDTPQPDIATPEADPIPDSVKPRPEESAPPASAEDIQAMRERDFIARVCGYFAAFVLLLALFLMFALAKGPLTQAWPPSVMLYELMGLKAPVPGEGLVIDQLSARLSGESLVVEGRVINLTPRTILIPPLAATLIGADDAELAHYDVPVEQDALSGESDAAFTVTLPIPPADAKTVRVGFTLE